MLQILADGLIIGSVIALGAIGLSFTMSIFRFSNFSHGELVAWGAYLAMVVQTAFVNVFPDSANTIGVFSVSWGLAIAVVASAALTAMLALGIDLILFRRLRRAGAITLVIASFGASLALRNVLLFWQGGVPKFFSDRLQIAIPFLPRRIGGGVRFTPDQLMILAVTTLLAGALHLWLQQSTLGTAMRATASNPSLARVVGINPEYVYRATWIVGGTLAAVAGAFVGLSAQLRPSMGEELLLPLFSAVILGGIGSLWGAVLGGLLLGVAESVSVFLIGAAYRSTAAFLVLIAILACKPTGLFGKRA